MSSNNKKTISYHYDYYGNYIGKFTSNGEIRKKYFSDLLGTKSFFNLKNSNKTYYILPDKTLVSLIQLGKEEVTPLFYKKNSTLYKIKKQKSISLYNTENVKIATFVNPSVAAKLSNVAYSAILQQLKNHKIKTHSGLIFKYD